MDTAEISGKNVKMFRNMPGKQKTNPYYRFSINEPKTINEQAVDRELECPVILLRISVMLK